MSQGATSWRYMSALALTAVAGWAQVAATPAGETPSWRRIGEPSINSHLAGPSTGPVSSVWYSTDGASLYARTASGRIFQTADFENWTPSDGSRPDAPQRVDPVHKPEAQANVVTIAGDTRRFWSLGHNLLSSDDGGRSWTNISGPGDGVIGSAQHDVAGKPDASSAFAVANDAGVWQTQDGGETWAGLNDKLPNLPISRILSTTRGTVRVALEDGRTLQLGGVRAPWNVVPTESALANEASQKQRLKSFLGAEITAVSYAGEWSYAGSADGRIWTSRDRGVSWLPPMSAARGSIERIYVDKDAPRAALAVAGGPGARLLRTVDGGAVWDDVTGNLAEFKVHAAVADRAAGVAYAATERGVFMARVDMNAFAPASLWQPLNASLPAAPVVDIELDATGSQLFAALYGYGLFSAPVPVRTGAMRITNSADFSTRPAAPGSLISVLGAKVATAHAGDLKFPVLASDAGESQLQVPFEARANTVDLSVDAARGPVNLPLTIRSVSPAIFVDPDGFPFLVDADSGLALDAASVAHPRARLRLLATGLGRVQPMWPTGVPAPVENPPAVVANVKAYLDGVPLEVSKATLAPGYVGYYLIEVQLPAILNAGPAEFYVTADGEQSNRVRVQLDPEYSPVTE